MIDKPSRIEFTYGDKIKLGNRTYKVLTEKNGYIYFGSFADKISVEDYLKLKEE